MGAIWTEQNKYQAWLEVEILACEAWAEIGDIPKEDVAKIRENADAGTPSVIAEDAAAESYMLIAEKIAAQLPKAEKDHSRIF